MNEPTHLDLFSGIGGFALAAQWAGFRTVAFCELDKYCQKVLAKNFLADAASGRQQWRFNGIESNDQREGANGSPIGTGLQPTAISSSKIHSNIFDFDGTAYRGVSLITGGFPCQPFSVAGKRRGAADDRAIWPQMFRVITQARPAWVLGENVPGIVPMELDNVLSDLEGIGYATRAFVIPACAVDARHRRDRVWIIGRRDLADTEYDGRAKTQVHRKHHGKEPEVATGAQLRSNEPAGAGGLRKASYLGNDDERGIRCTGASGNEGHATCPSESMADASSEGLERRQEAIRPQEGWDGNARHDWESAGSEWRNSEWLPEPAIRGMAVRLPEGLDGYWRYPDEWEGVPRVSKGVKDRVSRLKSLGNSIQPQVAYEILLQIKKLI